MQCNDAESQTNQSLHKNRSKQRRIEERDDSAPQKINLATHTRCK